MEQWNEFDMQIVNQCAPVLLGIKMSNILFIDIKNEDRLYYLFQPSINTLKILHRSDKKLVVLVYRKEELQSYLIQEKVNLFLQSMGYEKQELDLQLDELAKRFQENHENKLEFPHEIGVFLGYPLSDVISFIENEGRGYIDCGYWKVYHNVDQAKEMFAYYDYAKAHMQNLIKNGVKLEWIIALYSHYDRESDIIYDEVG